jgi:hypothetical protein
MGGMGMRSATHQVRTTITRCRIILRYQHYAKGLLVCLKKGYQGGKRRLKQLKTPSATVMDSAKTLYTTRKH